MQASAPKNNVFYRNQKWGYPTSRQPTVSIRCVVRGSSRWSSARTGPYKTITNLCVMGFHPESKCMMVESIHPGVTREQIIENTGFELCWADEVSETAAPTGGELRVLREEVDPKAIIIGRPVT